MDDDHGAAGVRTRLPRFLLRESAAAGDRIALEADESHHARVRRLNVGDQVALFDGCGRSFTATVERSAAKQLTVRIDRELPPFGGESKLELVLAMAMLKTDRFEWLVEKATELGVARIRPFTSEHSLAQPSSAKQTRWRGIALSAAKQCGRSVVPQIDPPIALPELLADADLHHLFFWERATAVPQSNEHPTRATLVVGPEGGFSEGEHALALRAGCSIASLGPRILRAETAAIAAVVLAQATWGDLHG